MTHRASERSAGIGVLVLVVVMGGGLIGTAWFLTSGGESPAAVTTPPVAPAGPTALATTSSSTSSTATSSTTTTLPPRPPDVVPGQTVGQPWGEVEGLTMFRGNPTRTYYGEGPVPESPDIRWRFPGTGGMCGESTDGAGTRVWCGTGWTGQPVVWERPDGSTEVIFGAYDYAVHFLDAGTGEPTRPPFVTGDIIKGSVTLDPDGYPLLYTGSRDNKLRVIALDRPEPTQLWELDADEVDGMWNDDWDGNPAIVDDILYEGGENSWFFAVVLNRDHDAEGMVTVAPEVVFSMPAWTDELLTTMGRAQSIESSPAVYEQRVYWVNSAGRVVGLDVSEVRAGEAEVVFDYWVGDDADATVVIDAEGMLYVAVEEEKKTPRSAELGQLIKLDPYADDPYLWGIAVPGGEGDGGIWATPALGEGMVYVPTHTGRLLGVSTESGELVWEDEVAAHSWSSPAIVDETLVVATCAGEVRGYSLADPRSPVLDWTVQISEACLESTPAVWKGSIYLGSRDGGFYALGG